MSITNTLLGRLILLGFLLCSSTSFAKTNIMPLGDSITGSPGCWRAFLWEKLQAGGYTTDLDMVGTLPPQGCSVPHDGNNEGHGGILATNMADQNQLPAWLSATNPNIVLMHLGTNDVWSSRPNQQILNAFTKLVGQMRANNPNMKIIVAKIIPMDSASSCSTCAAGVITLNNSLDAWATGLSTSASPITLVDQWTGFSATADTYDGVHPNTTGDKKMADKWYPALVSALGGAASSAASSSSVRSSIASSTSLASSSSASVISGNQVCNWYGTRYPLCTTTTSGWGWENQKSCLAPATCAAQPAPYGIENLTASSISVASSSRSSLSSSRSSASTGSSLPPSSSSVSVASSSRSSSSSSAASLGNCSYVIASQWNTGFTASIRIKNNGTVAINGWNVSWQYGDGSTVTNGWNATISGSNPYSASNLSWNGTIQAGQTVEFGIQGTKTAAIAITPVVTGSVCQ